MRRAVERDDCEDQAVGVSYDNLGWRSHHVDGRDAVENLTNGREKYGLHRRHYFAAVVSARPSLASSGVCRRYRNICDGE